MALQLDLTADKTYPFNVIVPSTYARIDTVVITRTEVQIQVSWYKSATEAAAGTPVLCQRTFTMSSYDPKDPRPVKQTLYEFLKTMSDFKDSADV